MSNSRQSTPEWVSEFLGILNQAGVSDLRAGQLLILSDYSGKGEYRTESFLIFDPEASSEWPRLRSKLRERMPDKRRFSYKSLGRKSYLERHLEEFLEIADSIHGWLITISVSNRVGSLVTDNSTLAIWREIAKLKGGWKSTKQFESALRTILFLALILSQVIGETRKLEWISDQDDIFANEEKSVDVTRILNISLGSFITNMERYMLVGTSEIDKEHRGVEDLLSIPDFAAGAVGDFATHSCDQNKVDTKSLSIAHWLASSRSYLRKLNVEFRLNQLAKLSLQDMQRGLASS